jgi:cell division transport system permease protein
VAISVEYVAKETANNLRRNILMSSAAVLCVAVSLALVGMALLLKQGVANATIQWRNGVDLSIYMKATPPATPSQTQAVQSQLAQMPEVKSFFYVDQTQAYQEFKKMFQNEPAFTDTVTAKDLPPSFRVVPRHPELIDQIGAHFTNVEGVDRVVFAQNEIRSLLKVTRVLQLGLLFFAIVLLLSASLLILNTIRMAIFARRREVGVMKLVGATNWFIRIPFMIEGMVQGVVGALVAFVFVYSLRGVLHSMVNNQNQGNLFGPLVVSSRDAIGTGLAILVVGAAVGTVGSAVAVTRFLDV